MIKYLILSFLITTAAFAHEQVLPTTTHPIQLMTGIGNTHHPVSTTNKEAQRFFDQGLALMFAFNHDAAFLSFKRASELDPQLGMAYWGMALALGSNINTPITPEREQYAYEFIQKAVSLASQATPSEKDYILALAQRYTNQPNADIKKNAQNYSDAMHKLMQTYPDDLDAAVLFAESALDLNPWEQWTIDGQPKPGTLEVVAVLENVLKRDPQHVGANHFYIHAIEASAHPERALLSAMRLPELAPESGHLMHMPAHIYILVGDYARAAATNVKAIENDEKYLQEYGMGFYPLHYMSHNLYFLSRAYSMEGRFQDALQTAQKLEAFYYPHYQMMPDLEYYIPTPMFVLYRFHQWPAITKLPEPNRDLAVTHALWHSTRAVAYASLGQLQLAQQERELFHQEKNKIPADATYGYNKADKIMQIASLLIDAKLAEVQQQPQDAVQNLQKAIAVQDTLHYNEPPDWFFPVRESLGGLLLKLNEPSQAEAVFRADLDRHPRNGRALFGLLESLKAQNKHTDVFWVQNEFNRAWKNADHQLTIDAL